MKKIETTLLLIKGVFSSFILEILLLNSLLLSIKQVRTFENFLIDFHYEFLNGNTL